MRNIFSFFLIISACLRSEAQDSVGRYEITQFMQDKSQTIARLWKESKIDSAIAVLKKLEENPDIMELEDYKAGILYNLACGYSLLEQRRLSFDYLVEAIDEGFSDYDQILKDPDLENTRSLPDFTGIIKFKLNHYRWESPVFVSNYKANMGQEEMMAGLSRVWSEVKFNFAYFDKVAGLDWDSLYLATIPEIKRTNNTLEYYRLLQKMCGQLHDGHTGINVPNEIFLELYARPAVQTRLIKNKVLIVDVLKDSLKMSGIRKGLEIISIDGVDVRKYAEKYVTPYHSYSTTQGRSTCTYEYYLLCGSKHKPVEIGFRDEEGKIVRRILNRDYYKIEGFKESTEFKIVQNNIAFIALNTFGDRGIIAKFDSLFNQLDTVEGLIIDLRDNSGGNSDIAYDILGYLTNKPFLIVEGKSRLYNPFSRAKGKKQMWENYPSDTVQKKRAKYFSKPVTLLVGSKTASAAEDFCAAFRYADRGILIGEPTAGSTGQPLLYRLPGGGGGFVCTLRNYYPDGKEFVGTGIQPDIFAGQTEEEIISGRDTATDSAISYLKNIIDK